MENFHVKWSLIEMVFLGRPLPKNTLNKQEYYENTLKNIICITESVNLSRVSVCLDILAPALFYSRASCGGKRWRLFEYKFRQSDKS